MLLVWSRGWSLTVGRFIPLWLLCLLTVGDDGVLTPSQIDEIKKLLSRQQQTALTNNSTADKCGQIADQSQASYYK